MVLQDTWLFHGTIRENIAYGRLDATEDEIVAAAEAAHVDHFVRTLPDGYDTVIDDDATNLSAGEKQLMTIARAFLADPPILILDEATSSVDTRTEVLIQRAMGRLMTGRTTFVIAHRLSTIRDADTILVMDHGAIVEQGDHDDAPGTGRRLPRPVPEPVRVGARGGELDLRRTRRDDCVNVAYPTSAAEAVRPECTRRTVPGVQGQEGATARGIRGSPEEASMSRRSPRLAGVGVGALVLAVAALSAACGASSSSSGASSSAAADPAKDKLAQILARGTLVGYAELDYPPQSIRVEGATRAGTTKCLPNQITAQEVTGFDVETTKLVAKALGVEACFTQPTWTEVTSGNWSDRFDLVYGSGAINATRMEHLWMTQPYYYVPATVPRPGVVQREDAGGSRRKEDRHLHELHRGVLPQGHAQDPRRRPRPEGRRTRSSSASRRRRPGSRRWQPAPSTPS